MNFRLRLVSRRKETKPKGKRETRKVFTKLGNPKQTKGLGSPVESPICGELKL